MRVKNRTFFFMMIIFWCCLMILTSSLSSYYWSRMHEKDKLTAQTEATEIMNDVREYLDEQVNRESKIAYQLNSTYWLVKLSNETDVFETWLTPLRLQEITKDFLFYTYMETEVSFRAIYFPRKEYVLHSTGYNKADYYFQTLGIPQTDVKDFLETLKSTTEATQITVTGPDGVEYFENQIVLLYPIQGNYSPNAYLYTALKTNVIANHISQILPAYITGVDVVSSLENKEVLSLRENGWKKEHRKVTEKSNSVLDWEVVFYIDELAYLSSGIDFSKVFPFAMLITIVNVALALCLTWVTYRPLGKIIHLIPTQARTGDAWKDLAVSLTYFRGKLEQANRETNLRRLLRGEVETAVSETTGEKIGAHQFAQTLLLPFEGQGENDEELTSILEREFREDNSLSVEILPYYDDTMVLCFLGEKRETLKKIESKINDNNKYAIFGSIERGPTGLADSFRIARRRMEYSQLGKVPQFYLPIDLESCLYQHLRSGESQKALEIYTQLQIKNEELLACGEIFDRDVARLGIILMSDMVRVLSERTSTQGLLESLENIDFTSLDSVFSTLKGVTVELGALLSVRIDSNNSVGTEIVSYINKNFSQCDLSINVLQDVFGLSANTINKHIRNVTGETFMPYLSRIRMDKARELLNTEGAKVSDVYRRVGYEQEYSFRRAFARYNGYKAQDHAAKKSENGSEI